MLSYGNSSCLSFVDGRIFNISGMIEGYENIQCLIPPNQIGRLTDRDFDIAYVNWILNNDVVFVQFFRVIQALYGGEDVFIIIDDADWSENLIESFMKVIQQRYGYNGFHVKTFEDYMFAKNNIEFGFDDRLLINLDQDKERYAYLVNSMCVGAPMEYADRMKVNYV